MSDERWVKLPMMPPKLELRMAQYKIELPPFAAVYDRVLVYPLDQADQPDKVGHIILPEKTKDRLGAQRGVIVSAGVRALEELFSHGIGLGDVVMMARFSHWERPYVSKDGERWHRVFIVQAGEIACSEDAKTALDTGELWIEINTETGKTRIAERERVDPPTQDLGEGA